MIDGLKSVIQKINESEETENNYRYKLKNVKE